jgi:hypothetical protein
LPRWRGATGQSGSALADRLLIEAIKTEAHPLIRLHAGALGPAAHSWWALGCACNQVISTLRDDDGDVDQTAEDLGLAPLLVRAALAYYADFTDEVEEDAAVAAKPEREERERWERQQRAIA